MTKRDWESAHVVGMFLNGEEIAAPDEHGERIVDDSFLLLFNGHHEDVEFKLPPTASGAAGRSSCAPTTRTPRPTRCRPAPASACRCPSCR